MILIASAAYVNSEFQIEFGRLPPAFLPIGNVRLFERQIKILRGCFPNECIYLSLPASYDLPPKDVRYLDLNDVALLRSDERMSLAESIAHALTVTNKLSEGFRLLHGDTLLSDVPTEFDVIGIAETNDNYAWEVETSDARCESVWCGYFSFSNRDLLKEKLLATKDGFAGAVRQYDLALTMRRQSIGQWYDFGHINTYFQSRARMTTERAFNSLEIRNGFVRKTGKPFEKIVAEAEWFKSLPPMLRSFCPQLLDVGHDINGQPYYSLEYLPLPPLNDIFVHGKNPVFFWEKIFELCDDFMTRCREYPIDQDTGRRIRLSAIELAKGKTTARLREFFRQTSFPGGGVPLSINGCELPPLDSIVDDCLDRLDTVAPVFGISHGDFCLSNILFDSRSDRIKVIDPRGLDAYAERVVVGDLRYDLAKLTHSVVGLYDHIIAGAFDVRADIQPDSLCSFQLDIPIDERVEAIQALFLDKTYIGCLRPLDVMPLSVLLFLSMLPLHFDNPYRQLGLFANALRLYSKFIGKSSAS